MKTPRQYGAFYIRQKYGVGLLLASLEARVGLADDIDLATTANHLAILVALLG